MSKYLGDYAEDAVLYFTWDTNDADGGSVTRATDGVVSVYKDDNDTPDTGQVTDSEDFDSLTGVHRCKIDLNNAFYETGADYNVVLVGAIIDGETVNATIATFSIENRFMRGTDSAALASVLGAAVGASISADIADLPTVAEFEARTIVSADYVVVGDTIAAVTLVGTCTTNSDLVTAAAVVNEWESQSQSDPTGFHVNVKEVDGSAVQQDSGNLKVISNGGNDLAEKRTRLRE